MIKKLKEVCDFYTGTGFPIKYQGKTEGIFPFYKVGDIANNVMSGNIYLSHCNNYISLDDIKEIKGTIIPEGVVVFAKIGEALKLNRRVITTRKCLIDNNAMGIGAKPEYLDSKFFYYYMKKLKMETYAESTTVPSVRKSRLEELLIDIPSFEKQKLIVNILSKIHNIINNRRIQLLKFEELIKARFVEMFGDPIDNFQKWPVKKLKDISSLITNGNTPKGGSSNYVNEGIIFIRSQNVWRNRIDLSDVVYIDESTHNGMSKSSVHHNDILITKTGRINTENSSLGRAALYQGDDNTANINGHVYLVRLKDCVNPQFVVTILTSEAYRKYIRKVCVGGIDKRQINLDQVENFPIIQPPLADQIMFASLLKQIDKSKVVVPSKIKNAIFVIMLSVSFGQITSI